MERNDFFAHLDAKPQYSAAYRDKLKDLFDYFLSHGYVLREHALNRVLGQKTGPGKRSFTKEEIIELLEKSPNYTHYGTRWIRYYDLLYAAQAINNGEIISVGSTDKLTSGWEEI